MDVFEPEYIGRTVIIKNTMLYNGQIGTLEKASDDPDDFWDYNVLLQNGTRIGVSTNQFVLAILRKKQCEAMKWYAENHGVQCQSDFDHDGDHDFD